MDGKRIFFVVPPHGRSYAVKADKWANIDLVWAGEKCWFTPGSVVTIIDIETNEKKVFVKELLL